MKDAVALLDELTISGAAARKIARLSSLYPDSDIRIAEIADDDGCASEAFQVDFLDEYGLDTLRRMLVRYNGWSNPSVARARKEVGR